MKPSHSPRPRTVAVSAPTALMNVVVPCVQLALSLCTAILAIFFWLERQGQQPRLFLGATDALNARITWGANAPFPLAEEPTAKLKFSNCSGSVFYSLDTVDLQDAPPLFFLTPMRHAVEFACSDYCLLPTMTLLPEGARAGQGRRGLPQSGGDPK